jgi:hypothetical protein
LTDYNHVILNKKRTLWNAFHCASSRCIFVLYSVCIHSPGSNSTKAMAAMLVFQTSKQLKLFWIGTPTWRLWRHVQTLYTGCPQNYWNNKLVEFEYVSTKLNAKMRKILTGCIYYKYELINKLKFSALRNLKQLLKRFLNA